MKKNEKGITLIQTVVTVICLILIASFAIFNSKETVVETGLAKAYNEITTIRKAVIELEILEEDGMNIFSDYRIPNLDSYPQLISKNRENQEYYYLDFKNNAGTIQNVLELRNIENNYIVNVKDIENVEVFLLDGVKIRNEVYYDADEIIAKYNDIFAGR